jgi:dTMP kinase
MFIVIEGLDGSGKTTQVKRVGQWFYQNGKPCLVTKQPSDGPIGALARAATQGAHNFDNETFALLFAAEHFQHYTDTIAPALSRGEYVICDRYYYSNLAYQGKDAATLERIFAYTQAVMNPPAHKPDLLIFLDATPEESLRRITANRTEISIFETPERLAHQRERYYAAFERLPETPHIIDTTHLTEDAVFEKIMHKIRPLCQI